MTLDRLSPVFPSATASLNSGAGVLTFRFSFVFVLSFALACLAFFANAVQAKEAVPLGDAPWVEARMVHISEELRCLVCQNETLASSRADLAKDLRDEVRDLIRQGKTDPEIKTYLVARYGDFVLYRPEVKPSTWALWWGPAVMLGLGLITALWAVRSRRKNAAADAAVDADTAPHLPQVPFSAEAQKLVDSVMKNRE